MELNVLLRGQSNALLFADRGGAAALERGLETLLGVNVNLLYRWGQDANTIYSATAFMEWDTGGEQAGLLTYVNNLPANIRQLPTATLWMHNEYDQKIVGLTASAWVGEVRADATLVRNALGQDPATSPYTFVPIHYPYGGSFEAIKAGMERLAADAAFKATLSLDGYALAMTGGPETGTGNSHMSDAEAVQLGQTLAQTMAVTLRPLAELPATTPPPPTTPPTVTTPPGAQVTLGTGSDTLVLKLSQDAYQGSAQYVVKVDGVQIGGTQTASALHGSGQVDTVTVQGDWGVGAHSVAVQFLNDAYGGTPSTDRNLYVDGVSYNGSALANGTAALMSAGTAPFTVQDTTPIPGTAAPPPPSVVQASIGTGSDTLVLRISQDAYLGSAQYLIRVDGAQLGSTQTAGALHGSGQSDTITVKGDWAIGTHSLAVEFLNDAYGGTVATDRNLYVDGLTYNGAAVANGSAALMSAGAASFTLLDNSLIPGTTAPPPPTAVQATIGAGSDTLVLRISQEAYLGSAQYIIRVDGTQVGGTQTAGALRGSGTADTITVKGDWAVGAHSVTVDFLNDAYGGTASTDRNLYVEGITYNGAAVAGGTASLLSTGPVPFTVQDSTPIPGTTAPPAPTPVQATLGSGADTLVLKLSQDAYLGSAQYVLKVDGVQVGGTQTAGALRGSGQTDSITILGDWAVGPHSLTVEFLNDAYGGTAATDRNLYVEGITYNGAAVAGGTASLLGAGPVAFTLQDGTPVPGATPAYNPVDGTTNAEALTGTAGADRINGGRGNDTLTGGGGADEFVFNAGDGFDVIKDFASGADHLLFKGLTAAQVASKVATYSGVSGLDVTYGSGNANHVFLERVTALAPGDMLFA